MGRCIGTLTRFLLFLSLCSRVELSGDFEIVPRSTAVIAMDERDFSGVRVGGGDLASSSSEDEDDWEILDMVKELEHEYESKKTRTWASIVRSKA